MTVQTQKNTINHLAVEGQDTFSYDFIILDENDVTILLDGNFYLGGYIVIGLGDDSGSVVLDDPISNIDDGKTLTIARVMDMIQDIDYTAYDGFPAETHERGLDRGILIAQQNAERVESSLRMPLGDDANVFLPPLDDRRETYLFFDIDGNATVIDAIPDAISLVAIQITDDSKTMMRVDSNADAQRPKIGGNNINSSLGMLQLNSNGKVPFANMGISGFNIVGPFRGDDLCDKPSDEIGDCTEPDTRNPSERFPDLVPTFPQEGGKFSTGDTFTLTFEEPETEGTMNLFVERGGTESVIAVGKRDMILFSSGWNSDGEPIPDFPQGWYHLPKMFETGDASSTTYSPDGNFILPSSAVNLQVAVDHIDKNAVDIQNRDQSIDGKKTFITSPASLQAAIGPNDLMRKSETDTGFVYKSGDVMTGALNIEMNNPRLSLKSLDATRLNILFRDSLDVIRANVSAHPTDGSITLENRDTSGVVVYAMTFSNGVVTANKFRAIDLVPVSDSDLTRKDYVDEENASKMLRTGTRLDIYNVRTA